MRILLVEDDEQLGEQVRNQLVDHQHAVRWRTRGDVALIEDPERYDLVVLDLMLPGTFGLDVLRSMRERSGVPIMVLSAKQDSRTRLRAFELGADDFVLKPFWPEELAARVKARLRRPLLERSGLIEVGPISIDRVERTVRVDRVPLELTRAEFDILEALVRRRGAAVTRACLGDHALGRDRTTSDRAVDVHVSRIRKKLGELGTSIRTVWGVGYRLDLDG